MTPSVRRVRRGLRRRPFRRRLAGRAAPDRWTVFFEILFRRDRSRAAQFRLTLTTREREAERRVLGDDVTPTKRTPVASRCACGVARPCDARIGLAGSRGGICCRHPNTGKVCAASTRSVVHVTSIRSPDRRARNVLQLDEADRVACGARGDRGPFHHSPGGVCPRGLRTVNGARLCAAVPPLFGPPPKRATIVTRPLDARGPRQARRGDVRANRPRLRGTPLSQFAGAVAAGARRVGLIEVIPALRRGHRRRLDRISGATPLPFPRCATARVSGVSNPKPYDARRVVRPRDERPGSREGKRRLPPRGSRRGEPPRGGRPFSLRCPMPSTAAGELIGAELPRLRATSRSAVPLGAHQPLDGDAVAAASFASYPILRYARAFGVLAPAAVHLRPAGIGSCKNRRLPYRLGLTTPEGLSRGCGSDQSRPRRREVGALGVPCSRPRRGSSGPSVMPRDERGIPSVPSAGAHLRVARVPHFSGRVGLVSSRGLVNAPFGAGAARPGGWLVASLHRRLARGRRGQSVSSRCARRYTRRRESYVFGPKSPAGGAHTTPLRRTARLRPPRCLSWLFRRRSSLSPSRSSREGGCHRGPA